MTQHPATTATPDAPTRAELDRTKGPVVVEFGTGWCGYCQAFRPQMDQLLRQFPDVEHLRVEDGPGRPLGRSFRVKLWPSFVFLRDGRVVRQLARPSAAEAKAALEEITGAGDDSGAAEHRSPK